MTKVKKLKSAKFKIKFLAGEWKVALRTKEGFKRPIFQTFSERITFTRDAEVQFVLRRMR